ncbi:uncharacterized protein LOC133296772 [Gastrolobium bilobum]|uniref:uncharacterized protein LOC133296772 n=1 Tax=Gastrolobium bilobum TaxID=150636 RepID=UPI002AB1B223|nr:uncharacterized protein LOC133296772 [Gastrolobium bilobum]
MAAQVKSFDLDSHSKTVSKNTSPQTSKMQNISSEGGKELLKALIRKRTSGKEIVMESKPFKASKNTSISSHKQQNHCGKELLKVIRKGTEKLNLNESKCKSGTHSTMCFCSPTTHEGSFRCRLHRISAANKSNSKRTNGKVEFKSQLSRFGRFASAEMGQHDDSLMQISGLESA